MKHTYRQDYNDPDPIPYDVKELSDHNGAEDGENIGTHTLKAMPYTLDELDAMREAEFRQNVKEQRESESAYQAILRRKAGIE